MHDSSIDDSLQQIRSERAKERSEGLANLKRLLAQGRHASLDILSDKAYHKILEALFSVVQIDSSSYAFASKATTKSNLKSRLSTCGGVIRYVVESGLRKLRFKTVKAVVDHITQTLPKADDGYCEPLLIDYFKTLRTILEYPPHAEHLPKSDWIGLVDYCIGSVQDLNSTSQEHATNQTVVRGIPRHTSRSSTPNTSLQSSRQNSQVPRFSALRSAAEDIINCIRYLCGTPNSPISHRKPEFDRMRPLVTTLVDYLHVSANAGTSQQAALEALLQVLHHVSMSDLCLASQTYQKLLPITGRFWQSKPSSFRDLLSIHLLWSTAFVPSLLCEDQAEDIQADILEVIAICRNEYCRRTEREQLQIDDLEFSSQEMFCTEQRSMSTKIFAIRYGASKAEQPWALLQAQAELIVALDADSSRRTAQSPIGPSTHPMKRQRLNNVVDELLRFLRSPQQNERFFAAQVFAMIFDIHDFESLRLTEILETLLMRLSDSSGSVASWSMLALAAATSQRLAKSDKLRDLWSKAWHGSARIVTSYTYCTAACILMGKAIVSEAVAWGAIEAAAASVLSSLDLNGPAYLNDASCFFLSVLLSLRTGGIANLTSDIANGLLRWLFARWKPSDLLNKAHVLRNTYNCPVIPVLELMHLCLGLPFSHVNPVPACNLGRIAQEQQRFLDRKELQEYLLFPTQRKDAQTSSPQRTSIQTSRVSLSASQQANCHGTCLDLIILEASAILDIIQVRNSEIQSWLNSDTVAAISSFMLFVNVVCCFPIEQTKQRGSSASQITLEIAVVLREATLSDKGIAVGFEGLIRPFGPLRANLNYICGEDNAFTKGLSRTLAKFDISFWTFLRERQRNEQAKFDEAIDLEDHFDSQGSHQSQSARVENISHNEYIASTGPEAFQGSTITTIIYCSTICQPLQVNSSGGSTDPSIVVDYFMSLKPQEFLYAKAALKELFGSKHKPSTSDITSCLEYIAQELLQSYEYERCEVSLGICLDIMTSLSAYWADPLITETADIGSNLYEWFIKVALQREISSPHVHTCLSAMLQQLIKIRPHYAHALSLESARTSLFRVLRDGNLGVKYRVGRNISDIFGLFVLKEHDQILEDIIHTLPEDGDWLEGIALRLYVLAHLGAAWPTLLRRSVYAIFETPQHVPGSLKHAKYCLEYIATSLNLSSSRELFRLFAAQIVYTWSDTEAQSLIEIPFSIFGYESIAELLGDVKDEIMGQIVMRGKHDEALEVADILGRPLEELLEISFSKAATYSIIRDISMPLSDSPRVLGAESRLRNMVGKEAYTPLLVKHFADIIALVFRRMDQESHILKGFEKQPKYDNASTVYLRMKKNSSSEHAVPVSQQPSFKAGYLVNIVTHLCWRTPYEVESMWTTSLYVFVLRQLLNDLHKALGSLHACSVIRRVRILIAMAGPAALESYAIEMTLRALRPYLSDVYCADDVFGMMQYLLEAGIIYLQRVPSFMIGLAVLTLSSVKQFLGSTQDSTTQGSHFRSTLSKASNFHSWFAEYLRQYESPELSDDTKSSFARVINAACNVRAVGNARDGTYESDLLLEVLRDKTKSQRLLTETSRNSILEILCVDFEHPPSAHEDVLSLDETNLIFASSLWSIYQQLKGSENFALWAGRSLGRAYAMTGSLARCLHDSSRLFPTSPSVIDSPNLQSVSTILTILSDLLEVDDPAANGAAEMTLRNIIQSMDRKNESSAYEQNLPQAVVESLTWKHHGQLDELPIREENINLRDSLVIEKVDSLRGWVNRICIGLVSMLPDHPLLSKLRVVLYTVPSLAEKVFPCVLHLVLLEDLSKRRQIQPMLREEIHRLLKDEGEGRTDHLKVIIQAMLYLRRQAFPDENTKADRYRWLDIDHSIAADAAIRCSMFFAALLFLETNGSEAAKASRRSSGVRQEQPAEALIKVYTNIDEPDSFYGLQQPSSLASMRRRLEYEHAGFKSLSFSGAFFDSQIRLGARRCQTSIEDMVQTLDNLSLHGISRSLVSDSSGGISVDTIMRNARKLEQWDISIPSTEESSTNSIFRMFQSLNGALDRKQVTSAIDTGVLSCMKQLSSGNTSEQLRSSLCALVTFAEVDKIYTSSNLESLQKSWDAISTRDEWMHSESFGHVKDIMSCRETIFSILSKNTQLQSIVRTSKRDALNVQVQVLLESSRLSRAHEALPNALATTTHLTHLVEQCDEVGICIDASAKYESAQVLWHEGEMSSSIRILQQLRESASQKSQAHTIPSPELLATLGHQVAEARLEKSDEIISHYLGPAIRELHGTTTGTAAGKVFHEFAFFCDQQLQNPDALEDFRRLEKLRARKEAEVQDLDKMIKSSSSQNKERDNLKSYKAKAKQWFDLDDREYQRLRHARETFLRQSLENYLLCLRAGEDYNNDALRFSALWLENWSNEIADQAVSKFIRQVAARKFAPLMNQWSSRLLSDGSHFQELLSMIVTRICVEHPYHGMYQIFASSKTKGGKDDVALSRHKAATNITERLKADPKSSVTWRAIHNTNIGFVRFATDRLDDAKIKPGSRIALRKSVTGQRLESDTLNANQKVPPPTLQVSLRADCDYSSTPMIARFAPDFTVASGISMPKIVTAIGTDGQKYKQLFKGGNDDLRQDSIMEQVFDQVSSLLKSQRATRQRNLGIRTYKVLPLTATSGIIEFVPNTIPLHDYLMPAHARHFPRDMKPNVCRKHISDAQARSSDHRIKTFKQVIDHFHPVLRYFFTERFDDPEAWFQRRTAYTRSTAAISILGHALGLGDRHGHNILLDEQTGEVVHIDLGIAFEQGRVLPVPEVVPFRLTRDLVDGMGITGTEGVFRRCCEFTLEALRTEVYTIMTILDVLRYDPLYSWSLSPLRLKKMQEAQTEVPKVRSLKVDGGGEGDVGGGGPGGGLTREEEPGEADRALMVVRKKLSKSLSVEATVNELIGQATSVENLALLFCGWAAYA